MPAGLALRAVPGQVSSGPGWRYSIADREVDVTGEGTELRGLNIGCDVNITASGVTIRDDRVVTGGSFGISLRHTARVTIEDTTVSGLNTTTGRVDSAISDLYGDSTGLVIRDNNIAAFRTGVQVTAGLVTGNYIHDFGYIAGDHSNGIYVGGGMRPLMIYHNTILNNREQTDAINLDASVPGQPVANKTIRDNLLAGGSYTIYGGAARSNPTSHIVVDDNQFSQAYYPRAGQWGPVVYFAPRGTGNAWTGNIWDTTGQAVPAP